ncbi:glycosyltransferase involved in cell wall biosynthesis [Roseivirga ehrenbergii]|uniref:Glycosyl transferase family 1 domain-containing protein n=1 Tax=Roseivirga ehrenbergii (strain DSM 102268 / JCM 13514 / KCTC 12282 / NCIMB 14502 / KMM 6017) TaxID=279360 RepID=A0A150X7V5_ROSEK|nr:glycosyltransferase family 4 protein [Roseivirga ehrenbergii]KYG74809.1 hypothetical protein MB14_06285 [Roseivirga ehrenbergii]TCL13858.1 glycosyltransferase involved in cell wall biosynthesis [Roseivirga ehrenbergii]
MNPSKENIQRDKKIVVVHLRNDLSGSTRVLQQSILALQKSGFSIDLFTATIDYEGFLSEIPGISIYPIPYKRYSRRIGTFISYLFAQIWLFIRLLKYRSQCITIYINTVLPFGAALAGWVMKKAVVYHLHEISLAPAPMLLKKWLFAVANLTAKRAILVSDFLINEVSLKNAENIRIHNVLSEEFLSHVPKSLHYGKVTSKVFRVLMICSLAPYKGVNEFIGLSKRMPDIQFDLVLNATEDEIKHIFNDDKEFRNLTVHSAKRDVHQFYHKATLLLNLSLADEHVETFGMTILEGMAYGLPSIAPRVGGVLELVENHVNGFLIDSKDQDSLFKAITLMKEDTTLYHRLSKSAIQKSKMFNSNNFDNAIVKVFLT